MKTPEEIKQIVTRLAGVAEVLKTLGIGAFMRDDEDNANAYGRAANYIRDAADLIDELMMANATPKPEFPEGSLAAQKEAVDLYPGRCQLERITRNGRIRCWSEWRDQKVYPGPEFEGMYGEPVLLKVCLECAAKEIRWTVDGKPYRVD